MRTARGRSGCSAGCAPSWRASSLLRIRSKQRDPNPKGNSLVRKETSTYKGFHSMFAALFSYQGVVVRIRVPLFAAQRIIIIIISIISITITVTITI